MHTAIIFDMDGVLIDSQPLHYEMDIRVLKACGYPATLDSVTPYTGLSNQLRWPKYKEAYHLSPTVPELIKMSEASMWEVFGETNLVPIDGIPPLLQSIKDSGTYCGVASASPRALVAFVLEKTGLTPYFDSITTAEEVAHSKPAPDIYLCAAQKAGFPPTGCIAIEDSPAGILSAHSAGFTCIAYTNPNTYGQVFTHADYVITHFDECFPIIERLANKT